MKLSGQKRIWLVPIVISGVVALTGWWCHSEVRRAIEAQLENELESLINADVTALDIWIENQLRFVSTLASEERVKSLALKVVERASGDGVTGEALRQFEEVRALKEYVGPRLRQSRLGFVVIDPDGVIVAAPFDGMLGDQLHDEALAQFQKIITDDVPVLLTPYQPPRHGPFPSSGRRARLPAPRARR